MRGVGGSGADTEPADHPVAGLTSQPLPHPDGSVCRGAVLLQPEAPSGNYHPHLRPDDGLQEVEINFQAYSAVVPPGQDDLLPLDHWLWPVNLAEPRRSSTPQVEELHSPRHPAGADRHREGVHKVSLDEQEVRGARSSTMRRALACIAEVLLGTSSNRLCRPSMNEDV